MANEIIFNGKSYASVNAMPAKVREDYERTLQLLGDQNRNVLPDIVDNLLAAQNTPTPPDAASSRLPLFVSEGQVYTSEDDMPPAVRQRYEQTKAKLAQGQIKTSSVAVVSNAIVVEGKTYASLNDMPPELQQKYGPALANMNRLMGDANQNGMPDVLEGVLSTTTTTAPAPLDPLSPTTFDPAPSVIGEPAPNRIGLWLLWGGLGLLFLVCGLGLLFLLPMLK